MFIRRGSVGARAHMNLRVRLLGLGAVVALIGMATARDWLVNVAIGILVLGFGLRFIGRREDPADDDETGDDVPG